MQNYCNFKTAIILQEYPFIMDAKTVKVVEIPEGNSVDAKKTASSEVYAEYKRHGVEYLVLTQLAWFV